MSNSTSASALDSTDLQKHLQAHKRFYKFEGWLLIALGVGAAMLPTITAIAFNVIIAIALLTGGIGRLLTWRRPQPDNFWRLAGGLVFSIGGLLMLLYPMQGIAAFVMLLGALLIIEGVFSVASAFFMSTGSFSGWLMLSGIVSVVIGALVLGFFPEAGMVYLALTFGLSLALTGACLLLLVKESHQGETQH
jgi:uncharacterized membrane protein HdeD (DUF308 family)